MYEDTVLNDESALEAIYGVVNPNSIAKETPQLTTAYRAWIERAPFMAIASIGRGGMDCSPRGDKPGQLFRILDDQTIAIPDRRGNNRLDTIRNIVADPRVALLFLLPGINESLRINGEAIVVTDTALRNRFAVNGSKPVTVVVVTISSVYFQCARALMRSGLWSTDAQVGKAEVPTAGEMIKSGLSDFDSETYDAQLRSRQRSSLY